MNVDPRNMVSFDPAKSLVAQLKREPPPNSQNFKNFRFPQQSLAISVQAGHGKYCRLVDEKGRVLEPPDFIDDKTRTWDPVVWCFSNLGSNRPEIEVSTVIQFEVAIFPLGQRFFAENLPAEVRKSCLVHVYRKSTRGLLNLPVCRRMAWCKIVSGRTVSAIFCRPPKFTHFYARRTQERADGRA